MNLSKSQSKYIRSLALQKFRERHAVYTIEGEKIILEYLAARQSLQWLIVTKAFINEHFQALAHIPASQVITVSEKELSTISNFKVATQALAVVSLPTFVTPPDAQEWCLALQDIRDPGNMGTMLRTADWFGINHIIVSPQCVSVFHPKVVQSAMGAHLRLLFSQAELEPWLTQIKSPIYAAVLKGTNIYENNNYIPGAVLIGNESQGLPPNLSRLATHHLHIPGKGGAESLNAAVATGIICALLLRN